MGAFDDYQPPAAASSGGAFAGYQPPADAPSRSDSILDHLHRFALGLNAATRVATDAPTFGLMDKLFGSQAQADTAQAYKDVGSAALPLSLAGSMVTGQGELAGAKAIGEAAAPYIGKWAGGVLGSGAVGAGTSALGAYGHEAGWTPDAGDIEKQAAIGGGIGALGGSLGGVVGRGAAPASVAIPTLQAAKDTASDAMGDVLYNNADIRQKATQAITDIGNAAPRVGIEGQGAQKVLTDMAGEASGRGAMSAERVNDYLDKLHNFNTGDSVPVAGQIGQGHLNDLLANAMPVASPSHIPLAPGAGRTAIDDFNTAYGRLQDTNRIAGPQGWQAKAAVSGGPTVADQAGSWLRSDEGQRFAAPGTPLYDALNTLAGTPVPPKLSAAPSTWDVRHVLSHAIEPLALAASGGLAGGAAGDWNWEHMAEGAGTALLAGYGVHKGLPVIQNLARSAPYQAAQDAARATASTGALQAPVLPPARVRDAIRMLTFTQGQKGAY